MIFLRSPLVHFFLFGLLIFTVQLWRSLEDEQPAESRSFSILLESERIGELKANFERQTTRAPNAKDLEVMIAAEIDEEILFREALANGFLEQDGGVQTRLIQKMLFLESESERMDADELLARAIALDLHREDVVVRRILVQKMSLQASSLTSDEGPSDDDVAEVYRARREALRNPDRRNLIHVFFSADERADRATDDAETLLGELRSSKVSPSDAVALGDPFPLGHRLLERSELDLQRSFGEHFGQEAFATPVETWSAPITSAYGQHLVWTSQTLPGTIPTLDSASDRIRREMQRERGRRKLEVFLRQQRSRYEIVIETNREQR